MASRSTTPLRLGMATFAFSLLAGCAGQQPPPVDTQRIKQFAGRGYLTDDRYSIATTYASWIAGGQSFDVAWTLPVSGASLPLVVYLPGLGESRTAGEAWRTAWAQAGYAVLAFQPLASDRRAWSSDAARRGDFGAIAREHYSAAAAAARMRALATLLGELKRRAAAGDLQAARVDVARVAIAGYDTGAYTAMLAAGETPPAGAAPMRLSLPIAAFVALSPYADFSGTPFAERYRDIAAPVLSVSGDEDADALGAVPSAAVRKAPFENMPARDACLLWLANGTHAAMSGSPAGADAALGETGRDAMPARSDGPRRGRRGGDNVGALRAAGESPTERALTASLIEGVTTAFLDAQLKQDPIAQEWLRKDAARWIGDRGELRWKARTHSST